MTREYTTKGERSSLWRLYRSRKPNKQFAPEKKEKKGAGVSREEMEGGGSNLGVPGSRWGFLLNSGKIFRYVGNRVRRRSKVDDAGKENGAGVPGGLGKPELV